MNLSGFLLTLGLASTPICCHRDDAHTNDAGVKPNLPTDALKRHPVPEGVPELLYFPHPCGDGGDLREGCNWVPCIASWEKARSLESWCKLPSLAAVHAFKFECRNGHYIVLTTADSRLMFFYDQADQLVGRRTGLSCHGSYPATPDGCVKVGEGVNCLELTTMGLANVGDASVSGGAVNNWARVVAGMRAGFRACYDQGLRTNPDMRGSVLVTVQIDTSGGVSSATASQSGSISGPVAGCMAARAKSAQFDPPDGGAATLAIPITLVPRQASEGVQE